MTKFGSCMFLVECSIRNLRAVMVFKSWDGFWRKSEELWVNCWDFCLFSLSFRKLLISGRKVGIRTGGITFEACSFPNMYFSLSIYPRFWMLLRLSAYCQLYNSLVVWFRFKYSVSQNCFVECLWCSGCDYFLLTEFYLVHFAWRLLVTHCLKAIYCCSIAYIGLLL